MTSRVEHLAEGVTLYLGDCREILPGLPKVDAVVTDPPYGIGAGAGMGGGGSDATGRWRRKPRHYANSAWDENRPDRDVFDRLLLIAPAHIIWGGNYLSQYNQRSERGSRSAKRLHAVASIPPFAPHVTCFIDRPAPPKQEALL